MASGGRRVNDGVTGNWPTGSGARAQERKRKNAGKVMPRWPSAVPGKADFDAGRQDGGNAHAVVADGGARGRNASAEQALGGPGEGNAEVALGGPGGGPRSTRENDIAAGARPHHGDNVAEIKKRWRAYYGDKRIEPNWDDPKVVAAWRARMRDISCFIKDLQQRFTSWYNRTRPTRRRGTLWADRFKNTIVQGETALWACIRYVEMNPVRAGVCADPAEYRFGTWGRYKGSGRHPFQANVVRHLRRYLGEQARGWSGKRILAELNADMARIAAAERGESSEAVFAAESAGRRGDGFVLTAQRRMRYWSDGAIIGSRLFVRDIAAAVLDPERAEKKRLAVGRQGDVAAGVYSWRRLNPIS